MKHYLSHKKNREYLKFSKGVLKVLTFFLHCKNSGIKYKWVCVYRLRFARSAVMVICTVQLVKVTASEAPFAHALSVIGPSLGTPLTRPHSLFSCNVYIV